MNPLQYCMSPLHYCVVISEDLARDAGTSYYMLDGVIHVVRGERLDKFRVGLNDMWQWFDGTAWVGYSEFKQTLK